jgi:peptidyl-prolyl cis-trans isomerase C
VRRVILLLAIATAFAGCSRDSSGPKAEDATSAPPRTESSAPPPAALPTSTAAQPVPPELPPVVARVNGEDISKTEFENAVRTIEVEKGGPVPVSERDRVFRGLLDRLIGYKLLLQESRTRSVTVTDAEVEVRFGEVRKQFPSDEAFKKMLEGRRMTIQQIRSELRNEMVVNRLLEAEVVPKASVADEEVKAFYERNPKQFHIADRVRASHVLIAVPAGANAAAKAEALSQAAAVLKQARGGGDFAALAREHSQDPGSASSGGDLGYFQSDQMVGPFSDAAFKLTKGGLSDVVETEFGYHIIKVTDRQPGRTVPLEEARPKIEQYLRTVNLEKETQAFVRTLRGRGKVDVFI